jgi:tetratricopeptide (TPR) repeat protein
MSQPASDRNLLFGIIALQMDFITRDALIAAMNDWLLEKAKSLGEILTEQGALVEDEYRLLEALVCKHLERHGDNAGRSLSALSPVGWIRHDFEPVADLELTKSLARLADAAAPADPDATSWLAEEPVSAWPEPWWMRIRRWTRRHQAIVAGGAAMLVTAMLALAAGFVAVSIQKRETERHRGRAEANFRKASDAVERLLTRVCNERLKDVPLMESLRGELLEDALQFQRGFLGEGSDDPDVLLGAARVARLAGELQFQLNRIDPAEQSCRQAMGIIDDLLARNPRDLRYRRERSSLLDMLGLILATLDRTEEAESSYRKALEVRGEVLMEDSASGDDAWRMAACFDHLGILLRGAGRWEEAEHFLNRGRKVCEVYPDSSPDAPRIRRRLVAILGHLGPVLTDRGRRAEALESVAQAVRVQRALLDAAPDSSEDRELLIMVLGNQANAMGAEGQTKAAERVRREACERATSLKNDYPSIARYQQLAASNSSNLANDISKDPARHAEVRELYDRAISIEEGLVAMAPKVPEYRSKLAQMCDGLANYLRARLLLDEAEAVYRKELSHQERLAGEQPQVVDYRYGHGQALHNLGDLLRERGHPREGLPLQQEAVRQFEVLYRSNVKSPYYRQGFSYAYWTLVSIHVDLKDHRSATRAVTDYLMIEPNGFEESFEAAGFLCRCIPICRGESKLPPSERETLVKTYADRAIDALRTAVRNGFRDVELLQKDDKYGPLRTRDEFRQLVHELETMAGPAEKSR